MATTASTSKSSSTDIHSGISPSNTDYFIDERYPKTSFKQIPPMLLANPSSKLNNQSFRLHHTHRFRTQPVTLTEIHETDEENQLGNDSQQVADDYERVEHLTLAENIIRRTPRKKVPSKNLLERQRLKTTREELSETDGNGH